MGKINGYTVEELEQQIKEAEEKLTELKRKELEERTAARKLEEAKKSELRKLDVVKVQDAANIYLSVVKDNKLKREELEKAERDAYAAYKKELKEFADKHQGYHLTYTNDGDNVEFKIEETRADESNRVIKNQLEQIKRFWNDWFF